MILPVTLRRGAIFVSALLLAACCAFAQEQAKHSTRFGSLSVGRNKELLFRGRALEPPIVGNNGLEVGAPFRVGAADVVLVTNNGGTACPYLYYFVSITRSEAKPTPSFGTCSVATSVNLRGNSISVTMHGYRGPFEPETERQRAAAEWHVFVFREGVVVESGKRGK
jgi:hypothetical protein